MNDNARFTFTLNTAGTAYINQSDPTLIGSTIIKNSLGYTLRYKNGETLTFNIRGWLTATTDRNGNRIQILRDNADAMYRIRSTSGFLAFGTTPIQSGSQLVYRIDNITDQVGRIIRYTYNSNNQLIRVTRQDGLTISYDYDATNGNMTQLTDARGIVYLKNFYDSVGRIVQQTQPEGLIHKAEYTQFDPSVNLGPIAQTKVTLPNGNINTYNFNNELYPTNETDALGQVYQSNRLPGTNQVASITDPLARTAQVSYDATGNVTQLLDPQGNKTQITYEPTFNLPSKVTNDIGNAST
jgi:YD repeat-containing protein